MSGTVRPCFAAREAKTGLVTKTPSLGWFTRSRKPRSSRTAAIASAASADEAGRMRVRSMGKVLTPSSRAGNAAPTAITRRRKAFTAPW
jgi:hypothetical protein